MQITIEIPDTIAYEIQEQWQDLPRKVLESLSIEDYKAGILSREQI